MPREIKFRAWDNECHIWRYTDASLVYETGNLIDMASFWSDVQHGDYINVGQYIGITDGAGTEIYDGDIVKHMIFKATWEDSFITEVRWNRTGLNWNIWLPKAIAHENWLVIGNIYQNIDLLKETSHGE